eukprot:SAG22_NODE_14032_length_387_cov_0.815972_1_plen_60_part_10
MMDDRAAQEQQQRNKSQLIEMGFLPSVAEQALADVDGDVAAAVAMLSSSAEAEADVPLWR